MAFVKLKFPVLISTIHIEGQLNYLLRPLFVKYPIAFHRRFELAMNRFRNELKHQFKSYELNRDQLDDLLWYMFHPTLNFQLLATQFQLGNQLVKGNFAIASFELKEHTFVCIPAFDNYMFLAKKDNKGKIDIPTQAVICIQSLLRQYKEQLDEDFELSDYYAPKGTFVSATELTVNIQQGRLSFDRHSEDQLFSQIREQNNFDGATEIEKVGYDLNSLYPADLEPAYFRDSLLNRLYQLIYKHENIPLVLVGADGVGKNTIIHEVVRRHIINNSSKNEINVSKIWYIDPARVISGMVYIGWWQRRFEAILKYLLDRSKSESNENNQSDKLLIDKGVAMLRIGQSAQNKLSLSDVLRPYLEKRKLQLILLSTPEEWKLIQESDRRFSELFQVIRVNEPDQSTAVKMILKQRKYLELEYGCEFSIQAIYQLLSLQRNYLTHKALPGSVMRIMNQMAVKYKYSIVDAQEVREDFENRSGLSEKIFDPTQIFKRGEVRDYIAARLVGQPEAVETLADVIHLVKAKLNDPTRPLGAFLFTGPTGVGKTEAAKVLSDYLVGKDSKLMRFDMNEYIDSGALYRLIGDVNMPEGHLTSKVRYQPFGVVLLDEIEKAHPSVRDLLLQVLDDGRLTDNQGRVVDFTNTIIIMTSNLGAQEVSIKLGFDTSGVDDSAIYRKAIEQHFRPEFVNRIDKIVVFHALQKADIVGIARLQIQQLLKRDGFVRRMTILNISKEALEWVARRGFNAKMGGRALKRQIEKDLTTLSADQLISKPPDEPIIFEIKLQNGQLLPSVIPLQFEVLHDDKWLPELPDISKGKGFYMRLLRQIEQIERMVRLIEEREDIAPDTIINIHDNSDNLNWRYYNFKDRIAATKQRITNLSLGFRDRHFREGPAIPLRLKSSNVVPRRNSMTKGIRENRRDRWFQEEALKEISEQYEQAAMQFDSHETEFVNAFLDVAFLELFCNGFKKDKVDIVKINFRSLINDLGKEEISQLITLYESLLTALDISYSTNRKQHYITAEGYSVAELLSPEEGIHLFYKPHQNPLPLAVSIDYDHHAQKSTAEVKVIRVYHPNATLTDLRTGFSNAVNITSAEFKLLLYAGLTSAFRNSMNSN